MAMNKSELESALKLARQQVEESTAALKAIEMAPENNVFASLQEAEDTLSERLREEAFNDCEGAGNCGADAYVQEFIVDGVHYIGTLQVEYNRHDKTYYYIEETSWTASPK